MQRIEIANQLSFSRIIHGLWRLADWNFSDEETLTLIEFCLENGITTFDHADIYGSYSSESLFGRALALKPELRSRIELVTKCGIALVSANRPEHRLKHYNTSKNHIIKSVDQSLLNLRTDYIDTLLIHRPDPFMDPQQVAEAFNVLKDSGKVRSFGVSNFKYHQFSMLQSYLDFKLVTNQIELSPYQLENFEDGTLNYCVEKKIPPMAWSPLARGKLFTGTDEKAIRLRTTLSRVAEQLNATSIDEIAYAWLLNHPAKILPIIGSGKKERIQRATTSLKYKLTTEQWFDIFQSSMGYEVP